MSVDNVMKMLKDNNVEFVDLMFGDMFGTLQHFTFPVHTVTEDLFEDGLMFDGSSIRGWKGIEKSDMQIVPDAGSAFIDPFRDRPTLCLFGDIYEPRTGQRYDRDPRSIAWKSLQFMSELGIGDTVFFGPEPEFFIFDGIRYASDPNAAFYEIQSIEGPWSAGEDDGLNLGHKIKHKHGYFPTTPQDTLMDLRSEIVANMIKMGMDVELHHHEVATAGQCEIDIKYDTIIGSADNVHKLKYAVKNTAFQHGKTATFMP
ncbi:MAG: glutamine synthetase beta-grasp domain-containing protein, partial [Planctomycetota bacterium]